MEYINSLIKRNMLKLGIDIHRFKPQSSPTAQILSSLRNFDIDLIFDIGANEGQFASEIRNAGYAGNIVSFEPLSRAQAVLQRISKKDPLWKVHSRCALGDKDESISINVAANLVSSSILPMLDSHISAAPGSAYTGIESVPCHTLDSIAEPYLANVKNPFLKIDTQGYEWQVLDGAKNTLPFIKGLLVELSFIPLYEGQHLFMDIQFRLHDEGFFLWALQPGFVDPHNGRTLQMDGLFFKY